ncbi:hypothetical protein EsH8_VIII_000610 [Colletotrichum jinshuiense]
MKFSQVAVIFLGSVATALPQTQSGGGTGGISALQARVASNNPSGDVGSAILFRRRVADDNGGQNVRRAKKNAGNTGAGLIQQLQETFDRNNPNGTPAAPGDPDDLNGDGVINVFEAGAQAS